MLNIIYAILPVFMLIALGYTAKHYRWLSDSVFDGLEHLSFYFLFPALLITTLINADFSAIRLDSFLYAILTTIIIVLIFGILIYPLFKKLKFSGAQYSSIYQGITRWHGFIGLTISGNLYGAEGLVIMAIILAIYAPLINIVNVLVIGVSAQSDLPSWQKLARIIYRNPVIIACTIGLGINYFGILLPQIALGTLELLGRAAMGLSLLALGSALILNSIKDQYKPIIFTLIVKLILLPILMVVVSNYFGVVGVAFNVAVLAAAVPTAAGSYILARKMGGDATLMANIVTVQVIASLFTLPIILFLTTQ